MPHSIEPRSRRAVIVAGNRTPFVKAFGPFMRLDAVHLGVHAVRGLLQRAAMPWDQIDAMVWGGVVLPSASPNVGREIALELGLPHHVQAVTVSRACASGLQAVTQAAAAIERGEADVIVAGGGDSTSNAEVQLAQKLVHATAPVALKKNASVRDYLRIVPQLFPLRDVLPRRPRIAERSTGQLMGEAAEDMGVRNHVSREAQDELAARSHHRAAEAWDSGIFDHEVTAVNVDGRTIDRDGLVRPNTSVDKLSKLRPVFSEGGTLTAGNSSALTDGASAVLLMSEDKARDLGLQPLAAIRSWAYVGVDPSDQLLMGPAIAMPLALERAGLSLDDIDVVDMHEAFAAQVLSVLHMLQSEPFARLRLGRERAVGHIAASKLNIYGGSLALGHPFAATGGRMVTTMARELQRSKARYALLGICAAGGLGAAAVLERV